MQFEQIFLLPIGLWAALALLPLLLLYLLRPRPKKQTIPSLMFLLRDQGNPLSRSFFRRLFRDALLLFHLLMVLGFVFAIAQPYVPVERQTLQQHAIVVLDSSASMLATDSDGVRYAQARDRVMPLLAKENTIILAGATPRVALSEASAREAERFIRQWRPSDEPTRLASSILAAQSLQLENTKMIVVSDFTDTDTRSSVENAIKTLQALGVPVVLEQVGVTTPNIGIIDVQTSESKVVVLVRNTFDQGKTVELCAGATCTDLVIPSFATESWSFAPPAGVTELTLSSDDGFPLDNSAVVSYPANEVIDVLLVTNGAYEDSALWFALQAIDQNTPLSFKIDVNTPPSLVDVDHDLIIFSDVDPNLFVSRTAREAYANVVDGAAAIVIGQSELGEIDYERLLPFTVEGYGSSTAVRNTEQVKSFVGMEFGSAASYLRVRPERTIQTIAQSIDEEPLIALFSAGQGNVLYFGLQESEASFSLSPEYPLFWKRMIDLVLQREQPEALNKKTGELFTTDKIESPDGVSLKGRTVLDMQGVWMQEERAIAVNLLSSRESDLSVEPIIDSGDVKNTFLQDSTEPKTFTDWILLGIFAVLFLELLFLKWRGDI